MTDAHAALPRRLGGWAVLLTLILAASEGVAQPPGPGGGGGAEPSKGKREKPIEKRVTIEGQLVDVLERLKTLYAYAPATEDTQDVQPLLALVPNKIKGKAVAKGMEKRCFYLVPSTETQKIFEAPRITSATRSNQRHHL